MTVNLRLIEPLVIASQLLLIFAYLLKKVKGVKEEEERTFPYMVQSPCY